ncbi:hypothetical protein [Pectobacterium versatile]|uniref:hypothetical protein n=1 Tax=Pectobacterium versatile TaxID=2488639 RepID=UPI002B250CD0|nr:hypothetical protein [Pectobacterium versatile]
MKTQKVNAAQLTDDQIFDLASYVMHHGVISINSPETEVSEEAEQFSFSTSFDSISVWVLNGWPVAAADEEIGNSWVMLPKAESALVAALNEQGGMVTGKLVDDTELPEGSEAGR